MPVLCTGLFSTFEYFKYQFSKALGDIRALSQIPVTVRKTSVGIFQMHIYRSEFIGICLKNILLIKYSNKNSKVESSENKTNLINFHYFPSKALNEINRKMQSTKLAACMPKPFGYEA